MTKPGNLIGSATRGFLFAVERLADEGEQVQERL